MPKNIIPKDNIPKIFEVREVDNKIPTYEEFMKTYQQEQANYSDLTYTDIGSSKNYGPMWGNSQYGERWTDLRIPCPVSGCSNRSVVNQTHTCGGQIEISNKARIKCRSCGTAGNVRNWSFNCSNHQGYRTTSGTDLNSFKSALMTALNNGSMDSDIVMGLIRELMCNPW